MFYYNRNNVKQFFYDQSFDDYKFNLYETDENTFLNMCEEKRNRCDKIKFDQLRLEYLKKSWFALSESTGGAAKANIESIYKEERALAYIELALKELL